MSPRDVLLFTMRWHFEAKRYDEAARIASMAANFVHPRLTSSAVTVHRPLADLSDSELGIFVAEVEAELAQHGADGELAAAKPQGSA